jgi:hypothetical protein
MKEIIKKDILSVLKKSIVAIKNKNIFVLREQSNHTVHNSSIFQDKYSILTAVVIYSIYKILEKYEFKNKISDKSLENFLFFELKKSISCLEKDDFKGYIYSLKKIMKEMNNLDSRLGSFVDQVIHVTKIKKATKIHEHGISSERVADLLGIPTWEVMSYIGHTKTFDDSLNISESVENRLKLTKRIFKIK